MLFEKVYMQNWIQQTRLEFELCLVISLTAQWKLLKKIISLQQSIHYEQYFNSRILFSLYLVFCLLHSKALLKCTMLIKRNCGPLFSLWFVYVHVNIMWPIYKMNNWNHEARLQDKMSKRFHILIHRLSFFFNLFLAMKSTPTWHIHLSANLYTDFFLFSHFSAFAWPLLQSLVNPDNFFW